MGQDLILITGATGHVGFRTLSILLQHGYRARVAHRRPEQVELLKKTASLQPHLDAIEFVQIPDITAADAYDEAVKGVDGILHIASPIYTSLGDGETDWKKFMYDPAEKGSTNILTAALKEPRVKRVIITSSAIVLEPKNGAKRVGPYDVIELPDRETMKNAPDPMMAYILSKVLAHVSATKFVEDHPGHYDLIRILPGYVQGANELQHNATDMSEAKKSGSNEGIMTVALGHVIGRPRITGQVYLDDVANAHVLALKPEVAKHGDNLLIMGDNGDCLPWAAYVPVIEKLFPDAIKTGILKPSAVDEDMLFCMDVSASEKALGYKFAGSETMVESVVGKYIELVG